MRHKKKEADYTTSVSVEQEMAKPRMARSARIAELKLNRTAKYRHAWNRGQNLTVSSSEPTGEGANCC